MPKKLHKEIPIDYAVCQQQDCPRAGKCLHQIAYQPLIEQPATVLRLLNPTLCTRDEACPYFRDSAPVTYARGFTGIQSPADFFGYDHPAQVVNSSYNSCRFHLSVHFFMLGCSLFSR